MNALPPEVFKRWLHSHEEDSDDIKVYRPHAYPFPRSRGRRGMEFFPDGDFIQLGIAPTDGSESIKGRWQLVSAALVKITFPNHERPSYHLFVVSCEEDVLRVKRVE